VRFFDAEERSGSFTRGVLKFRQKTIFWREIFLSPSRTTDDCANSEPKKSVNRIFYFVGIIVALKENTTR
jgi:hypothetical protein